MWHVKGSYYEACNCQVVCPCRREGDRNGGRSTYGECDFVLSWWITDGEIEGRRLDGRKAVLVGRYSKAGSAAVQLKGALAGQSKTIAHDVTFAEKEADDAFLAGDISLSYGELRVLVHRTMNLFASEGLEAGELVEVDLLA